MIDKSLQQTLVPTDGSFPSALLMCMDEAVFAVDSDCNIYFANAAASSISGYSVEELVGTKISSIAPFLDDDLRTLGTEVMNSMDAPPWCRDFLREKQMIL